MTTDKIDIEYYTQHCDACNKWLNKNAPDYVINCVRYISDKYMATGQTMTHIDRMLEAHEKLARESAQEEAAFEKRFTITALSAGGGIGIGFIVGFMLGHIGWFTFGGGCIGLMIAAHFLNKLRELKQ